MESIPPWIMVGLGVAGFFLTWTGMAIGWGKTVAAITAETKVQVTALKEEFASKLSEIKEDTTSKITDETSEIQASIRRISERFEEDQRTQDNRFGETAAAIREYVNKVEKEMHQIEIWGRDNYVLKTEFIRALEKFEDALDNLTKNFRDDAHALGQKMDSVILRTKG